MLEVRAQGRPARGDKEVGRARLLERARHIMNAKPKVDLQRREIALAAGVTPALVSYYYPDKWDLVAAAGQPIIAAYAAEARAIMSAPGTAQRRLGALTYLFVEFNFRNSHLLDFFLENSGRMSRRDDMKLVQDVKADLTDFFDGLIRTGVLRDVGAAFVRSALWGICRHLAQRPDLVGTADQDAALRRLAERAYSLFLSGVAAPALVAEEPMPCED